MSRQPLCHEAEARSLGSDSDVDVALLRDRRVERQKGEG